MKSDDKRRWELEFGVKHYAGCVYYNVKGFVDKNRDVQQDVFFDVLSKSTNDFVKELTTFQQETSTTATNNGQTIQRGTSKSKPTVSDTFRHQLQALVDVLQSTNPWYVRCIKPNSEKVANDYDDALVMDQLKYLGMLDIIRIRKEGFQIHLPFEEFYEKFWCLAYNSKNKTTKRTLPKRNLPLPDGNLKTDTNLQELCKEMLSNLDLPRTEWQIGKTKIFMRCDIYDPLEEERKHLINSKAIEIQKIYRGWSKRRDYQSKRNAILKVQHAYKGWKLRLEFLRKRRAAIIIQSHLRGVFAREVAAALREMRRVEEEMRKRELMEEERKAREAALAEQEQIEKKKLELEQSERFASFYFFSSEFEQFFFNFKQFKANYLNFLAISSEVSVILGPQRKK